MKVKNDPRSEFSNLNNWKEEAWKKSGLLWTAVLRWRASETPSDYQLEKGAVVNSLRLLIYRYER